MPDIFIPTKKTIQVNQSKSADNNSSRHLHRFASFCTRPLGISFQNEEPDEKILLFLRKHFITNIYWILATVLLAFVPPVLAIIFSKIDIFPFDVPGRFTFIMILFYYLAISVYAFIQFITWFYDIGIVTQKRVIDLDYSDIIHQDLAITKLSLVQDVNYVQTGPVRSFFNIGDVFIQTAGNNPNFDFLAIPQPGKAAHIIQNLIGEGPNHND